MSNDYKRAVIAVAVVGGVGVGAGLIARRLWHRKNADAGKASSARLITGESSTAEVTPAQTTTTSNAAAKAENPKRQPVDSSTTSLPGDSLSTSGTFEKVPASLPQSFEQVPARQTPTSTTTAAAAAAETTKLSAGSSTKKLDAKPPSVAATGNVSQDVSVTMKDKNDIVVVETDSSRNNDGSNTKVSFKNSDQQSAAATAAASQVPKGQPGKVNEPNPGSPAVHKPEAAGQ